MGSCCVKQELTEEDIHFLKKHTRYDEETIREWYAGFLQVQFLNKTVRTPGLHESLQPCSRAARKWRENEEMRRKWRENEEMERDWLSTFPHSLSISSLFLHFLILSPFPPSLSISYIKMHHILLQNVKYSTFVANVTKISTCALWGNNSRQTWLHM